MSEHFVSLLKTFDEQAKSSFPLLFITRADELQQTKLDELEQLQSLLADGKAKAVKDLDEDKANLLLGCESVVTALQSELQMWLYLKQGHPGKAWDELINAQHSSIDAVRAHTGFIQFESNFAKLEAIEKAVFPPQVFFSAGLIVGRQECSLCASEYGECDHLAGKPYMGRFCSIVGRELTLDHVAIVDFPADKRCRVTETGIESGTARDWMTLRDLPTDDKSLQPHESRGKILSW